ncbi:MAG TPA: polysaccharide biosynthesis tyrosine autokinase [Stellaceae bacterium]|nr:polysaccharide biosynthesis tyrosine autokinase [Stellaceae bacterium]
MDFLPPEKTAVPPWNAVGPPLAEVAQTSQVDIWSIVLAVLRRWKLVAIITLSSLVVTYGVLKAVPSTYKSTVEILVFDPEGRMDESIQKQLSPFVNMIDDATMNTELQIITSKSLMLRVVKKLGLYNDSEFLPQNRLSLLLERFGVPKRWWSEESGQTAEQRDPSELRAKQIDDAAEALQEHIQAERMPYSYILSISATARSPITAQRLAAAVADEYLASQKEAREHALRQVTEWLKVRLENLHSHILETEASIEKLTVKQGFVDAGVSEKQIAQQISEVNTQLITARGQVQEKRAQLDQALQVVAHHGDVLNIPEVMASPIVTKLREQRSEWSWRAQQLRRKFGGVNNVLELDRPNAAKLADAELANISLQISAEVNHILGNMRNSYQTAVRREQLLEANLRSLTASRGNLADYVKLQQLRRVADADRKLYDGYLSQLNEISTRRMLQADSARIIWPAALPRGPSSPRKKRYFAFAGILALGGGLSLAFLLELIRSGIKTSVEVERSFGFPVVGIIPFLGSGKDRRGSPHDKLLSTVLDTPLSQFSEAVRAVRIHLQRSNPDRTQKVLLITSSLPGEGKSTIAKLLAASSAVAGQKTVLVDCDLHHRQISAAAAKKQPGLVEVLTGKARIEDVTIKDPTSETFIIPAGSKVGNPADLLISQRMHELIGQLRAHYDLVVLDTSPLLAVVDALALATMVDKILMIVEWSRTSRASVSEAFKALSPEAHRIAGVVLNRADLSQMQGYGYISGYGYGHIDR